VVRLVAKTGKTPSGEKVQKTRRLPTVSCMPCWAAWLNGTRLQTPQKAGVRGSNHDRQGNLAWTPAAIMTRRRAKHHNHF